jgi:chromosome segregation ATPase
MIPQRIALFGVAMLAFILLAGCAEETAELKQKIADLGKKIQKQDKDIREFAGKFAPPKDFSADIQRIEDQQERISQAIKTKVDPVNSKLEEFREWAQDAQKDRETVGKRLKGMEQTVAEMNKRLDTEGKEFARANKENAAVRKTVAALSKNVEDLTKGSEEIRKEFTENNNKLLAAVKKIIPKIKDAAVAEVKDRLTPLEEGMTVLRTGIEAERKNLAALQQHAPAEAGKEVRELNKRIKELEDVIASQKSYMLEMGSKIHELELQLERMSGATVNPQPQFSRQ